ncbi:MAG: AmmeMemoRadiSam system radical SAM enzyme [Syntrophobacteraceae bacterium]|nr:AmmeMemoRadiSam system radical SAM enzyme [Syntrophobacteraceae bacterium]
MTENQGTYGKISRKQFLRLMTGSVCALGFGGLFNPGAEGSAPAGAPARAARLGFVRPEKSPWFSGLDGGMVRCELCPRQCELDRSQRSLCRVRENRDGEGHTLAYGNPVLIQEDPVERKPFFHVMPGSRALSISTAGCNLHCRFCEVWDMALVRPEEVHAYDLPPEAVIAHALAARVRSVSYGFGEPVVFYEYMSDVAHLARKAGLLNLVHTAGYIRPEPLKKLCTVLDAANVDLKSFDPAFYRNVVGGELEPVLTSLRIIREAGVHLEITQVVIPTLNDDMPIIRGMCQWIVKELGPDVPLHFARFYPLYKLSALPRTPVSTLSQARDTAINAGLRHVYVSRVTGHEGENTFCSGCGKIVIQRLGFFVDRVELENGACGHCGRRVPGLWS